MESIERAKKLLDLAINENNESIKKFGKNLHLLTFEENLNELDKSIVLNNLYEYRIIHATEFLESYGLKESVFKDFKKELKNGLNLIMWEKETFEYYLENEVSIYAFFGFNNEMEIVKPKLERIREVYEQRFGGINETEKGHTKKEILFIAEKLKIFDLDIFEKMKVETRNKILGKIFDCNPDTIKKYINFIPQSKKSTSDYYPTEEQQTEILKKYPDLGK